MIVMAFVFFCSLMEGTGSGIGHLLTWLRLLVIDNDLFEYTDLGRQLTSVYEIQILKIVE
jgi:hypothetical protein